jgi:hypothetical protein
MSRLFLILPLAVFFGVHLHASEEDILLPDLRTVTLKTDAIQSDDFGEVKATYSHSPSTGDPRLQDVSVEYRGKTMAVPRQSISDHPELIIDSARLSCERGYGPQPWLYLSFQLRSNPKKRFNIAFTDGKFNKTFIHP